MSLAVTNEDLVVTNGGGAVATSGHRSHYPIWRDDATGEEFISLDGYRFTILSTLKFGVCCREVVVRQ